MIYMLSSCGEIDGLQTDHYAVDDKGLIEIALIDCCDWCCLVERDLARVVVDHDDETVSVYDKDDFLARYTIFNFPKVKA